MGERNFGTSAKLKVLGFARPDMLYSVGDPEEYRYWRKPQPATWQSVLENRDGTPSNPSVTIYRSTVSSSPGSVLNVNTRTRFEQKTPEDSEEREAFGIVEDAEIMADGESTRDVMVIAKRGSGVDYEQKENSPFTDSDILRDMPGKTWKEIRYECIDRIFEDDSDDFLFSDDEKGPMKIDAYEDVDEYVWPPLHFMTDRKMWWHPSALRCRYSAAFQVLSVSSAVRSKASKGVAH